MSSQPNLETAGTASCLSLYEFESEFDTDEYEAMRETFRDTWKMKHGTKFISFSERTLGGNFATEEQYERLLNYVFLGFFICWIIGLAIENLYLAFASSCFLWIGVCTIVLNLRFTLIRFQFESMEFCYLIFSAIFTFSLACSLMNWDLIFTYLRFTYYITFIAIILFDCLDDRLRRTSKWVLFIGGLAFLINALRIQFSTREDLIDQGFVVRTYYIGRETDSWTNLATYCRMNLVQSFFCFKMFYHLHYHVDYSYFITERRRNENFAQFSLKSKDEVEAYAMNTFRSYAAFMEKMAKQKSREGKTPKSVRITAPNDLMEDLSDVVPVEKESEPKSEPPVMKKSDLERQKSDPTRIIVQQVLEKSGRYDVLSRVSLTVTVTNQDDVSETIIVAATPKAPSARSSNKVDKAVTFDVEDKPEKPEIQDEQDLFASWIPRRNLIKLFNMCAISILVMHVISLFMPMVILIVLNDLCIVTMGAIVVLNLKLEYYRLIAYDVEYIYLMLSCIAAWFFGCDVHGWTSVRIFRNTYTWLAIASFAHFDLLVNEMKQSLRYVLGFMVLSIWVLYANYLLMSKEALEDYYSIRSFNVSENDQYTNLELWTRISLIMSLFWMKLTYHLWYYFEYFYYNRLLIKLSSFVVDTSNLAISPSKDVPPRVSIVSSPGCLSPRSSFVSMSHDLISVTPDNQLTE